MIQRYPSGDEEKLDAVCTVGAKTESNGAVCPREIRSVSQPAEELPEATEIALRLC